MEKINLNGLYKDAVNARIAALREKAEIFVEKEAIPTLVEAAKKWRFFPDHPSPLWSACRKCCGNNCRAS